MSGVILQILENCDRAHKDVRQFPHMPGCVCYCSCFGMFYLYEMLLTNFSEWVLYLQKAPYVMEPKQLCINTHYVTSCSNGCQLSDVVAICLTAGIVYKCDDFMWFS